MVSFQIKILWIALHFNCNNLEFDYAPGDLKISFFTQKQEMVLKTVILGVL